MPHQKQSNKQTINIKIGDLIKKKKRKRRSKPLKNKLDTSKGVLSSGGGGGYSRSYGQINSYGQPIPINYSSQFDNITKSINEKLQNLSKTNLIEAQQQQTTDPALQDAIQYLGYGMGRLTTQMKEGSYNINRIGDSVKALENARIKQQQDQVLNQGFPAAFEQKAEEEGFLDVTPVVETPVEETPVVETPVEETPVEEKPVDETPVVETPKKSKKKSKKQAAAAEEEQETEPKALELKMPGTSTRSPYSGKTIKELVEQSIDSPDELLKIRQALSASKQAAIKKDSKFDIDIAEVRLKQYKKYVKEFKK